MNTLDFLVIALLLCTLLYIGYRSAKAKKSSAGEFMAASKSLNKLQAGFSMAATDFGGSGLVGAVGYAYLIGMSGIWWNLAAMPAFLLVGLALASIYNQMRFATLPEFFGERYSNAVRYLLGFMQICAGVAALSVQFTISCAALNTITGLNENLSLVISMVLVIFLTSGGLRAVVNTDALLFVIIVLSIVVSVPVSMRACGGISAAFSSVPDSFKSISELGFATPFSWFVMCTVSYSTNQQYIQRMTAAKNVGTAKFSALFTASFYLLISIALGLIGVAAAVLVPSIENTNAVYPQLLMKIFPQGILGLAIGGLFAATISTATSTLHSVVNLSINDIWKPIFSRGREQNEFRLSRICVVVVALFSLIIALFANNVINVLYTSGLFYGVSAFILILFGIRRRYATGRAAFICVIVTVCFSLLWEYVPGFRIPILSNVSSNVMGLFIGTATILLVSFLDRKVQKM